MKTKILKHQLLYYFILLSVSISFNSCINNEEPINLISENEKTYVPDNNFEQKLIDLGVDDILDDYVLTKNIINVVKLELGDSNIKNLTGIQEFKSLELLYCYSNQLTSLDVSNNTALYGLYCSDNEIKTLDLRNNKKLQFLECYQNQLTNLDLSIIDSLFSLWCFENQISCIKINGDQFNNFIIGWLKDDAAIWSLECN